MGNNQSSLSSAFVQLIAQQIKESMKKLREILEPLRETVQQHYSWLAKHSNSLSRAGKILLAIRKMGEAQYVCWDFLDEEFVDEIAFSDNTNKTLRQYILQDKFKNVNDTIEKTCNNPIIKKHLRLYNQSVFAFQNGCSDLAVTGFTSVFDGLLSDISNNPTHRLDPRISFIKAKIEKDEFLDNDEIATLTFGLTFEKTIASFAASSSFKGKEPKGLNRHWIAHGRSVKKKTKLDCVKMINLIYGLLLIEELGSSVKPESSCVQGE